MFSTVGNYLACNSIAAATYNTVVFYSVGLAHAILSHEIEALANKFFKSADGDDFYRVSGPRVMGLALSVSGALTLLLASRVSIFNPSTRKMIQLAGAWTGLCFVNNHGSGFVPLARGAGITVLSAGLGSSINIVKDNIYKIASRILSRELKPFYISPQFLTALAFFSFTLIGPYKAFYKGLEDEKTFFANMRSLKNSSLSSNVAKCVTDYMAKLKNNSFETPEERTQTKAFLDVGYKLIQEKDTHPIFYEDYKNNFEKLCISGTTWEAREQFIKEVQDNPLLSPDDIKKRVELLLSNIEEMNPANKIYLVDFLGSLLKEVSDGQIEFISHKIPHLEFAEVGMKLYCLYAFAPVDKKTEMEGLWKEFQAIGEPNKVQHFLCENKRKVNKLFSEIPRPPRP